MVEKQMDVPKRSTILLRFHAAAMTDRLAPTVVVRGGIRHDDSIGCMVSLARDYALWHFVPNDHVDELIEALEEEGEHVLLL